MRPEVAYDPVLGAELIGELRAALRSPYADPARARVAIPLGWFANRNTALRSAPLNVSGCSTRPLAGAVRAPSASGHRYHHLANVSWRSRSARSRRSSARSPPGYARLGCCQLGHGHGVRPTPVHQRRAADGRSVILAGLRVAAVSAISLVTVGAVIASAGWARVHRRLPARHTGRDGRGHRPRVAARAGRRRADRADRARVTPWTRAGSAVGRELLRSLTRQLGCRVDPGSARSTSATLRLR